MRHILIRFLNAVGLLALTWATSTIIPAAEKKADPTGTWTWTFTTQGGDSIKASMNLKLEGDNLTGTVKGRDGNETAIRNAKLSGDQISFEILRERDGNKITSKHQGKIAGDTIKGKIEFERNGETRTRDWEAKRESADGKTSSASGNVAGTWKYTLELPNGNTLEPTLKLKQDGNNLTGSVTVNDRESPISDGKIQGEEISFKVVRERDGETFTSKYNAKVAGDSIKGKINSNWGGNDRTFDFEAKRVKE